LFSSLKYLIIQRVAKDQFLQRKFSLDVLKKTKVLIVFKTDKKWFIKKLLRIKYTGYE